MYQMDPGTSTSDGDVGCSDKSVCRVYIFNFYLSTVAYAD